MSQTTKVEKDEYGNIKYDELKCCICLEENEEKCLDPNGVSFFKCYTCKEGYVCNKCIPQFDPTGSIYLEDLESVIETITCPCCRQRNWKYHYDQFVNIILEHDLWEQDNEHSEAVDVFMRNYAIKENVCIGCKYNDPTICASNNAPMCEECWT